MKYIFILCILISIRNINAQGLTWSNPVDVSASAFSNLRPSIALDAANNPIIMWGSLDSSAIFISKWTGASFSPAKRVTPSGMNIFVADWAGPNFAVDGNKIYIVYKQSPEETSNLWLSRSTDGGNSFTQIDVDDTGFVSRFPTVTVNASGNPVVGFMKFDSGWANARWVVTRSMNGGNSFMKDTLAGDYSGGEACDCCPGTIVSNGNNMAMMYRDNNVNIRDIWTGISTDQGLSFPTGARLDYNNWMIMACPSTGPDGFIIGDTLYSVFMNAASGKSLVHYSAYNFMTNTFGYSNSFTGNFSGLGLQNFPHCSHYNNNVATVWKQTVTGLGQIILSYNNQNTSFQNLQLDTIAESSSLSKYNNPDVVMSDDKLFAVWQDNTSKTVKFSYAIYNAASGVNELMNDDYPKINYQSENNLLFIETSTTSHLAVHDINGNIVIEKVLDNGINKINLSNLPAAVYVCNVTTNNKNKTMKILKN